MMASIRCVVPQARIKAPNSQKILRNGRSRLRKAKYSKQEAETAAAAALLEKLST